MMSSVILLTIILLVDVIIVVGQSAVKYSPRSQSARSAVHYAIEEETAPGTSIGHGVGHDSGFIERLQLADEAADINALRYRFLTQAPTYLQLDERDGVLRTNGRLDREEICATNTDGLGVGQNTADNSCQVRIDVAVQPMNYFQIFKVIIIAFNISDIVLLLFFCFLFFLPSVP